MNANIELLSASHTDGPRARRGRARPASLAAAVIASSGVLLLGAPVAAALANPPEHEHSVTTSPAEGQFRCGELLLIVTGGTQTEIIDGRLQHGVAHVRIQRRYDDVTLAGSDGRVYGATAHVNANFVLVAPDFDNPLRGDEVIHVTFLGGPQGSPGYLNEHLQIRDGVETDEVTGPCDYAD